MMQEMLETKKRIDEINSVEVNEKVKIKNKSFEERFKRITTYLNRDLLKKIKELIEDKRVESISKIVNASIKEYMITHDLDK